MRKIIVSFHSRILGKLVRQVKSPAKSHEAIWVL
jgi:hypothetical protein